MLATTMNTVVVPGNRWLIGASVLLTSAIVLAQSVDRLEISPVYDDLPIDEIYESAGSWRKPPMYESEWRAPRKEKEGRIKFGYDSAYEQLRARQDGQFSTNQFESNNPTPSTQFRLNF